jgi:hypothetical protein
VVLSDTAVVDRDLGCVPAAAWQRASDGSTAALGLIPVSVPELLSQLRGTLIPGPAVTSPAATHEPSGDAASSTAPARPINAGTHTPTRCHSRNGLQLLLIGCDECLVRWRGSDRYRHPEVAERQDLFNHDRPGR